MTVEALDEYGSYFSISAVPMIPASPLQVEDDAINHLMILSQRGAKQPAALAPPALSGTAWRAVNHTSPLQGCSSQKLAPRGMSLLPDSLLRMLPPAGRAAEPRPSFPDAEQTSKPPPAPSSSAASKRQAASVDRILRRVRACHRMPSAHLAKQRGVDEPLCDSRATPALSEQRLQRPDAAAAKGAPRASVKPSLRAGASSANTAREPLVKRSKSHRESGDDSSAQASDSTSSPVAGWSITDSARLAAKLVTLFGPDVIEESPQTSTPKRKKQDAGSSDAKCKSPRSQDLRPQLAFSRQTSAVESRAKQSKEAAIPSGFLMPPETAVDTGAAVAAELETAAGTPDRSTAATLPATSCPRARTRTDQPQVCVGKRSDGVRRSSKNAATAALATSATDSNAGANLGGGPHSVDKVQSASIAPSTAATPAVHLDVGNKRSCDGCETTRARAVLPGPGGCGAVSGHGVCDSCAGESSSARLDCIVREGCGTDGGSTLEPPSTATLLPADAEKGSAIALASHACTPVSGGLDGERDSLLKLLRARREAALLLRRTQLELEQLLESQQPPVRIDGARLREIGCLMQQHVSECASVESLLTERSRTPPPATPPERFKQRPSSAASFPTQPTARLPAPCSEAAAAASPARYALICRADAVDVAPIDFAPATADDTAKAMVVVARDSLATTLTLTYAGTASAVVTKGPTTPAGFNLPLATAELGAPDAAAVTSGCSASLRQASSAGRPAAHAATPTEEPNAVPGKVHDTSLLTREASAPALPRAKSCLPSAAPSGQTQIKSPHDASAWSCSQTPPPPTAVGATKRRQLQPRTGSRIASAVTMELPAVTMVLRTPSGRAPLASLDASEAECSSRFRRSQPTDANHTKRTKGAIESFEMSHEADNMVLRILQLVHGHHREARPHLIQVRMSPTMAAIETE